MNQAVIDGYMAKDADDNGSWRKLFFLNNDRESTAIVVGQITSVSKIVDGRTINATITGVERAWAFWVCFQGGARKLTSKYADKEAAIRDRNRLLVAIELHG